MKFCWNRQSYSLQRKKKVYTSENFSIPTIHCERVLKTNLQKKRILCNRGRSCTNTYEVDKHIKYSERRSIELIILSLWHSAPSCYQHAACTAEQLISSLHCFFFPQSERCCTGNCERLFPGQIQVHTLPAFTNLHSFVPFVPEVRL